MSGLIAAPFTPFDTKGRLKLSVIPKLVAHYKATGVKGAFVCGSTGEGVSMSLEERYAVAEAWRKAVRGTDLKLIVHAGHNSMSDCRALVAHAEKIGADAVCVSMPTYFRPQGIRELVDWCETAAAAAPKTPFYYYHLAGGGNIKMADYLPLAAKRIPTFGGIKFTNENLMDFRFTLAVARNRYDILFGCDELLLPALSLGAKGAVGSTYNYAAAHYNRIIKTFNEGNIQTAAALQFEAMRFIKIFFKHGGMGANKAILGLLGMDCGPSRQPWTPVSQKQIAALKADLTRAGFFELIRPD